MAQRLLLLVAVALAVVGHVAHADVPSNSTPPPACAGFECPDYEIIDTLTGGTQIRKYEEGGCGAVLFSRFQAVLSMQFFLALVGQGFDAVVAVHLVGMWVKYPVPNDDFIFMAEYGSEVRGRMA